MRTSSQSSYRALLATYLRPQARRVAGLGLLLGSSIGLPLANPQIVRAFIDGALGDTPVGLLVRLAAAYILIAVLIQITGIAATYMSEQVAWTATNMLRADLASHALQLDMPYHHRHTPGEMIERVDGDVTALANFFSRFVMNVVWALLMLLGVLALVYREDWRVGAALTVFCGVALVTFAKLRGIAIPHATAQREETAAMFGFLEERLAGVEDLRSSGAGHHVMRGFAQACRGVYTTGVRSEKVWAGAMWSTTTAMFVAGQILTLGLGAWLFMRGEITIGTVYLLYQYMHMLQDPIETIGDELRDFQKAGAGAGRAHALFGERPIVLDGAGDPIPDGPLSVELRGVGFSYGTDEREVLSAEQASLQPEPVLRDVTFAVPAGAVLGVLGRTGSGKTTLARMLLRLYEHQEGDVILGGTDISRTRLADLRARVGYVTQDVQLFGASVRDNLTLFRDDVADARIVAVLRDLGLGHWYDSLPEGLDSHLASGGGGVSAGEGQLLAFARVFLRNPGLVIMDEASSRLDPATERSIGRAVDALLADRTGIIIAHRLETVTRADFILVLDDGRIAEFGPRAALAADPSSRFARLLRTGLEEVLA